MVSIKVIKVGTALVAHRLLERYKNVAHVHATPHDTKHKGGTTRALGDDVRGERQTANFNIPTRMLSEARL